MYDFWRAERQIRERRSTTEQPPRSSHHRATTTEPATTEPATTELELTGSNASLNSCPSCLKCVDTFRLAEIEAQQQRMVSGGDTIEMIKKIFFGQEEDGLKTMFAQGAAIPTSRLRKLQTALRGVLDSDQTFEEGLPDGNCHAAARKMVDARVAKAVGIRVVVA